MSQPSRTVPNRTDKVSNAKLLNIGAIAYTLILYSLGLWLIVEPDFVTDVLGVLAIVHALVFSALLTHELIHDNLFKHKSQNAFWGQVMTWINGACYVPYARLVHHHFKHHVHHADFVPVNIQAGISQLPPLVKKTLVALEWAYFPAIEFWLRWRNFVAPFKQKNMARKIRTLLVFALRLLGFTLLAVLSPKAIPLYALAYVCFINIMRFVDAFQHTYIYLIEGEEIPQRDRRYEESNTFSNLISSKHPWLNLLLLNFVYHNAHHYNMRCPWHALPQLHSELYGELYGDTQGNILPFAQLVKNYHKFRLQRLIDEQENEQGDAQKEQPKEATSSINIESLIGGIGVSLLTPP
jgi:fatty acid desaturase